MSEVEKRLVELDLKADSLQKNAETAISTLKRLDEALQFKGSANGMQDLQNSIKNVDFSALEKNVESLTKRFSTMGEVGATAIHNLTNTALNAAKGTLKNFWDNSIGQIISGGWARATSIDQAKFKLQEGLGIVWDDMLPNIRKAVDGTAYGLNEAADAAAKLAATGMEYKGDLNDMEKTLRAISGVAAITNSDYSRIAYIFTQIAALGKAQGQDLRQLSNYGLSAYADMAKEMGITIEELQKKTAKGEVSAQQFFDIMYKRYADFATKANETFEGSIRNTKAALSRIGQEFFEPIRKSMVGYNNAWRLFWSDVKVQLDESGIYGSFDTFITKFNELRTALVDRIPTEWIQVLGEKAKNVFDSLSAGIDKIRPFIDLLPLRNKEAADSTKEVKDATEELGNAASEAKGSLEEVANAVIRGDYGNGEERIQKLGDAFKYVQNRVNEILDDPTRYDLTEEERVKAIAALGGAIDATGKVIKKNGKIFGKYIEDQGELYETVDKAGKTKQPFKMDEFLEGISQGIAGLSDSWTLFKGIVGELAKGAFAGLKGMFQNLGMSIADSGKKFGLWVAGIRQWFEDANILEKIRSHSEKAFTVIGNAATVAGGALKSVGGFMISLGGKALNGVQQATTKFGEFYSSFKQTEGYDKLKTSILKIKDDILSLKDAAIEKVTGALNDFLGTDFKIPEFDVSGAVEAMDHIASWISDRLENIRTAFTDFKEFVGGIGTNIQEALTSGFSFPDISFGDVANEIKKIPGLLFGVEVSAADLTEEELALTESYAGWAKTATESMPKVEATTQSAVKATYPLMDTLKGLWDNFKGFAGEIASNGIPSFDKIVEFGNTATPLLKTLAQAGMYKTIGKSFKTLFTVKLAGNASSIADSFAGIGKSIHGMFDSYGSIGKSAASVVDTFKLELPKTLKSTNKVIKNFAKGLPKSMKNLTKGTYQVMKGFGKGLPSVMKGFAKDLKSASKYIDAAASKTKSEALLNLAKAIGLLTLAFIGLSQLSWASILKGAAAITVLAIAIGFLMSRLNKSTGDSKSLNPGERLTAVLDSLKNGIKGFLRKIGWGALIISLGVSIGLVTLAISKLATIPFTDAMNGVKAIAAITAILAAAVIAISKLGGNSTIKQSLMLIALAGAINMLVPALQALGGMSKEDLNQGMNSLLVLIAMVAGLMASTKLMGKGSVLTFIGIAALIGELFSMVLALGLYPEEQLTKATNAIMKVLLSLTAVLAAASNIGGKGANKVGTILTFAGVGLIIAELSSIITSLASMENVDDAIGVTNSIALAMAAVAALIFAVGESGMSDHGEKFSILMSAKKLVMAGIVGGILVALLALCSVVENEEGTIANFINNGKGLLVTIAGAIGEVIGAFVGNLAGGFIGGLIAGSLVSVADSIVAFAEHLQPLADMSLAPIPVSLGYLVDAILLLAGSELFTVLNSFFETINHPLDAINPFKDADNPMQDMLKEMNNFVNDLADFASNLPDIDEDALEKVANATKIVSKMAEGTPLTSGGLLGWLIGESNIETFGERLPGFAQGLTQFSWIISFMNSAAVERTENAVSIVNKLASAAPPQTGFLGSLLGGKVNNTGYFGRMLKSFGEGMRDYSLAIIDMKDDAVKRTESAVKIVTSLASEVPDINNGILKLFVANDAASFGKTLVPFAIGMTLYSRIIGGMDTTAVTSTENAVEIVTKLASAVPEMNAIMPSDGSSSIITDQTLFGESLPAFARGMVLYSALIGLLDTAAVEATNSAAQMIVALASSIPKDTSGTILGFITGDNSLDNFGENLPAFARGLKGYADELNGADFGTALEATRQVKSLITTFGNFATTDQALSLAGMKMSNMTDWITGIFNAMSETVALDENTGSLKNIGNDIYKAIMQGFKDSMQGGGDTSEETGGFMQKVVSSLTTNEATTTAVTDAGKNIGEKLVESMKTNLGTQTNALDEPIRSILNNTLLVISSYKVSFYLPKTIEILNAVAATIRSNSSITSSISSICQQMVSIAQSYVGQFVGIGGDIMNGLAAGITMSSAVVTSAINNAMQSAINTGNTKLQINSPSKVFARMGSGIMEGLALGVNENTNLSTGAISDAVAGMVDTMVRGIDQNEDRVSNKMQEIFSYLTSAYSYINNVINDSLNSQPTITPVMDLSQVQNGVGYMNGLFGNGYAFGTGSLAYARNNWASSYQYGAEKSTMNTQAGIISAIRGVRSDINYLGERIANMQMVMDSGAIVGSIGGGMDRQLGNIQKYKERWA